jgi:hypothetical protein
MIVNGPDKTLQTWAKPLAVKELEEEDEIFGKYATDAAAQAQAAATLKEHGKHPDRYAKGHELQPGSHAETKQAHREAKPGLHLHYVCE